VLSSRQVQLIHYLEEKDGYTTIQEVAQFLKVSARTVRNDLDAIEENIKDTNCKLERVPRLGIRFQGDETMDAVWVLQENSGLEQHREKRKIVLIILLILEQHTTIEVLAERMNVSKNTLVNDLNEVTAYLEKQNVQVIKKAYFGIYIKGREEDIRNVLFHFYLKSSQDSIVNITQLIQNLSPICKEMAEKFINLVEEKMSTLYADESINELNYMIQVCFKRIQLGQKIEHMNLEELCQENKDYLAVLESLFELDIELPKEEIYYITLLFRSAKKISGKFLIENIEDEKIVVITESIIREFCAITNIVTNIDEEMEKKIIMHLKVAIHRLRNHMEIENPLLEDIKYSSSFIYDIAEHVLKLHEPLLGVKFPKEEIAYATMYFEVVFQQYIQVEFNPKVIIACNGGIATSTLLKQRLEVMMPNLNIITVCRVVHVEREIGIHHPDFIISTVPMKSDLCRVLMVNPMLPESDIEKINNMYSSISYKKKNEYLASRLEKSKKCNLSDLLQEEYCQFQVDLNQWREAIKLATVPLVENQKVRQEYADEMIHVVETMGNYMVFIPEIAFVHAKAESVYENSLSLLVLKDRIEFGSKVKGFVKVIVVVANTEENSMLADLISIITKGDNINRLKEAKSYKDLLNLKDL
jgi:mannitol operon transcriptional antiterminator